MQEEEESYSKFRIEELKYRNKFFQRKQQWQSLSWMIVGIVMLVFLYAINRFLTRTVPITPNEKTHVFDTVSIKTSTDTLRIVPKAIQRKSNDK